MDGKAVNVHKKNFLEIMQTTFILNNGKRKGNGKGMRTEEMQWISHTIDP